MRVFPVVLVLVAAQRGAELVWARANTRRLRAVGAREIDADGYKWFVVLHAGWLAALVLAVPAGTPPSWPWLWFYAALQPLRLWVVASLGRRWTTRLMVLPGAPLVRRGPYRWLRHPNYAVVAGEIAALPLAFGAAGVALLFSLGNLGLVLRRVRLEDRLLRPAPEG